MKPSLGGTDDPFTQAAPAEPVGNPERVSEENTRDARFVPRPYWENSGFFRPGSRVKRGGT